MSSLQFEDLMSMAESNALKGEKKIKQTSQFSANKPKRIDPKEKKLSEGVQKFLQKKAEEERRAAEQKRIQKEKLMELRSQDRKAHKRVNSMLRMTKSANKACIADAKNSFSDALAEQDDIQPDEDDYGYVSASSQEWHKRLMDKYRQTPPSKPARKGPPPAPVPVPQSLASKSKSSSHTSSGSSSNSDTRDTREKDSEFKQPEIPSSAKSSNKKRPPPPPNFQELLELANQKSQEPVAFNAFKPTKAAQQKKETFEFGRPMTAKEKAQYLQEKAYREKIEAGLIGTGDKSSNSSSSTKNSSSSQSSTTNKVDFKIPSLNKKKSANPNGKVPHIPEESNSSSKKSSSSASQNIPPSSSSSSAYKSDSPNRNSSSSSSSSGISNKKPPPQKVIPPPGSKSQQQQQQQQQPLKKSSSSFDRSDNNRSKNDSNSEPNRNNKSDILHRRLNEEKSRAPIDQSRQKASSDVRNQSMNKSKPMSAMSENRSRYQEVDPSKSRSRSPPNSRFQPPSSSAHRGPVQGSRPPPPQSKFPQKRHDDDDEDDYPRRRLPPASQHRQQRPPQKRRQVIESDEEYDSEMDDFIADDDEDEGMNVSDLIRSITGYDRNKYRNMDDDDIQESGFFDTWREEQRSAKIGRMEDLEDMRMEEEEKRRKLAMKKRKR